MHLRDLSLGNSTHISDLEDFLSVDFDEVVLLGVSTVDIVSKSAVYLIRVDECTVSYTWFVASGGTVLIAWENLRKGVSHFQLSIEPNLSTLKTLVK